MDWVGWPPPDRVVNLIVVIVWGWVSWHLGRGVVYVVIKIKAAKELNYGLVVNGISWANISWRFHGRS